MKGWPTSPCGQLHGGKTVSVLGSAHEHVAQEGNTRSGSARIRSGCRRLQSGELFPSLGGPGCGVGSYARDRLL